MKQLTLIDDNRCFVCGLENPDGLRIVWKTEGQTTSAEFIASRRYQGWQGIVHGGIVATLLDEAMARLAAELFVGAVTAEITVRYVAPARVGELLVVRGEVVSEARKLVEMKASVSDASGKVLAHATGKVIKL